MKQSNQTLPLLFSYSNQEKEELDRSPVALYSPSSSIENKTSEFYECNNNKRQFDSDDQENNSNFSNSYQFPTSSNSLVSLMSISIDPTKVSLKFDESNSSFDFQSNAFKNINNGISKNMNIRRGGRFPDPIKKTKTFDNNSLDQSTKKEIKPNSAAAAALAIANRSNTNTNTNTNPSLNPNQQSSQVANPPSNSLIPGAAIPSNYNPYAIYQGPQLPKNPTAATATSQPIVKTVAPVSAPGAVTATMSGIPAYPPAAMGTYPGYPAGFDPYSASAYQSAAYSSYYAQWQAQYYQQWQWASMNQAYGAGSAQPPVPQQVPQPPPPPPS